MNSTDGRSPLRSWGAGAALVAGGLLAGGLLAGSLTTSDGQRVTVEVGKDFAVTGEETGGYRGSGAASTDADT